MARSGLRFRCRSIVAALAGSATLGGLLIGVGQVPAAAVTPPVAVDDIYTITSSAPLVEGAPGVLANDTDDGPSASLTASAASDPPHGSVNLNPDGSFTYNADLNFVGTDTFTYTVSDGVDGSDTGGLVIITVSRDPAVLLKDFNPGSGGSAPLRVVESGATTFVFNVATDPAVEGLYTTDGTAAGTVPVKLLDLGSSFDSSLLLSPASLGDGRVVFSAIDATNGREPWVSDGTAAGTVLLKDVNPGTANSFVQQFTAFGGAVYFSAFDGGATSGVELYKTDGTPAGTGLFKDLNPGTANSSPTCGTTTCSGFQVLGSSMFFSAITAATGAELWSSDGTVAGTVMVKEIRSGTTGSTPGNFFNFGTTLLFSANDGVVGTELWRSDGTTAGTTLVANINPGTANSTPNGFAQVGSTVVFAGGTATTGTELFATDGTTVTMLLDIRSGTASSIPRNFAAAQGVVFFGASDGGAFGFEPWKTDGTTAGTVLLKDLTPGPSSGSPNANFFREFGGFTYFQGSDTVHAGELWRSDGTSAGTVMAQDINPGGNSVAAPLANVLGTMLLTADDGTHGFELWRLAPPNTAPVAVDDAHSTDEDIALTVDAPGVLGNDSDAEFNVLHDAVKLSDPTNGSVTFNGDGSFTYTPNADYSGPDSFTYKVTDGMDDSNVATVNLTVDSVNDGPVAVDDTGSTPEDTPLVVAAPGVLANDSDSDGGTLSAGSASTPTDGSVVLGADGSYTYTPDADFNGSDAFTYEVSDGQGGTDTATVNIAVGAANDAPVAADDTYGTAEDTPLSVNAPGVLANDSDADADPLTAGSATTPANGAVVLNADGSFTYTPNAGFAGSDAFTYTASDGNGGTDTATVDITVTDSGPAMSVGSVSVPEGDAGLRKGVFTVSLSEPSASEITVDYATVAGTASSPGDFTATAGTLVFAPGTVEATVKVKVAGDAAVEADEWFSVVLSNANVAVIADGVGTGTVVNDDAGTGKRLAIGDVAVHEGDAANRTAVFTVSLSKPSTTSVSVNYATANATATKGSDYTKKTGTLTFAPGTTSMTISVTVLADILVEVDETFSVTLSGAYGALISDGTGVGTIVDND